MFWCSWGTERCLLLQHAQHCPAALMCVCSIRAERPCEILLRFTQQLKPNRRPERKKQAFWSDWTSTDIRKRTFKNTSKTNHTQQRSLFTQYCTCFTGEKRWNTYTVGIVDGREQRCRQQVTSSSPSSSPRHASQCISGKASGMLIHAGRNGPSQKRRERQKKKGGLKMALNVWKSTLPIPAIKLERQQAQSHESECDRIVQFSMPDTGFNQTST